MGQGGLCAEDWAITGQFDLGFDFMGIARDEKPPIVVMQLGALVLGIIPCDYCGGLWGEWKWVADWVLRAIEPDGS